MKITYNFIRLRQNNNKYSKPETTYIRSNANFYPSPFKQTNNNKKNLVKIFPQIGGDQ